MMSLARGCRRVAAALIVVGGAVAGIAGGARSAQSEPPPPAVFIVDGSGSMWGNLSTERLSKFDTARDVLRQSLMRTRSDAAIGLVSFGHRRKSDCSDVEAIAMPEAGPVDRIPNLVDKLNPKGKGPLALALREAAKLIPTSSPGTLVVLHDGIDNCQQDACAAAADIAKANPRLVIHAVSIGLEKADVQRMMCVPAATRGKLFDVKDTPGMKASLAEIVKLARLDMSAPPQPKPAVAQVPSVTTTDGPTGLTLTSSLSEGGGAFEGAVSWRVLKDGPPNTEVAAGLAPRLVENLPPGKYVVEARYGLATVRQQVDVAEKGATAVRVVLNAGTLKLAAHANKNSDALGNPLVTITPETAEDVEATAAGQPMWIGRDPEAELVLPAGSYRVRVEDGLARREAVTTVGAGERVDANLVLGTGRLELSALLQEGGEALSNVTFLVSEDDPDAPQGRRELARSAAARPDFVLPAGTYYVTARLETMEMRDRIAVGSGDSVKHGIVLNAAKLLATAQISGPAAGQQPVTFRILRLEGTSAREFARSSEAAPVFLLTPGRYRIEAQVGALNVKAAAETDVMAGKEVKVTFKLDSAEMTVSPTKYAAGGLTERHWLIRDSAGKIVSRANRGEARTVRLAPGRYIVQSGSEDTPAQTVVDLKAGEQRMVQIGP